MPIAFIGHALIGSAHAGEPQKLTQETIDRFLALGPEVDEVCRSFDPEKAGFDFDRFTEGARESHPATEWLLSKNQTVWTLGIIEAHGKRSEIERVTKNAGYATPEAYFAQGDLIVQTIVLIPVETIIRDYISELNKLTPESLATLQSKSDWAHDSVKFMHENRHEADEITRDTVIDGLKAFMAQDNVKCRKKCSPDWEIAYVFNAIQPVLDDLKITTEYEQDLAIKTLDGMASTFQNCEKAIAQKTGHTFISYLQNDYGLPTVDKRSALDLRD